MITIHKKFLILDILQKYIYNSGAAVGAAAIDYKWSNEENILYTHPGWMWFMLSNIWR